MLRRTVGLLLTGAVVAGVQVSAPSPLSAQTDEEILSRTEHGTTARFRDEDGVQVERRISSRARFTEDKFFNEEGDVVKVERRYLDGWTRTEQQV